MRDKLLATWVLLKALFIVTFQWGQDGFRLRWNPTTQAWYSVLADGYSLGDRYCVLGAIATAMPPGGFTTRGLLFERACDALKRATGASYLATWNDRFDRKHSEVVTGMARALVEVWRTP